MNGNAVSTISPHTFTSSENCSHCGVPCTDTSDLRHFGPKTFRQHVFGAEVSHCPMMPKGNYKTKLGYML